MRYEELNGEIVVLDAEHSLVHRLSDEAAAAVRAADDEVSRRRVIGSMIALGVAAGVTTLALPSAAAAASGGDPDDVLGTSYTGFAGSGLTGPTNVNATAGDSQVTVSWNSVVGATKYRVYKSTSQFTGFTLASVVMTGPPVTIQGLSNGTEYFFLVVAVNETQVSGQSAIVSATPVGGPAPEAPTNLRASIYVSGEIWLYWDPPVSGPPPGSYEVQHRVSGAPTWTASGTTTATDLLFSSLNRSTPYEFRVRSVLNGKSSPWSIVYSATTQ